MRSDILAPPQPGYPVIDGHIEKQREFAHTIAMLRSRYHDTDPEEATSLLIVLGERPFGHVLKDDMKYSETPGKTG